MRNILPDLFETELRQMTSDGDPLAKLAEFCTRRGVNYLFTSNQVPFDRLVLGYLRQRGLVR